MDLLYPLTQLQTSLKMKRCVGNVGDRVLREVPILRLQYLSLHSTEFRHEHFEYESEDVKEITLNDVDREASKCLGTSTVSVNRLRCNDIV